MKASQVVAMLEEMIENIGDVEVAFSMEAGEPVEVVPPPPEPVNRVFGRNGHFPRQ